MRTKIIDNEIYYYANDIAEKLRYKNKNNAINKFCNEIFKFEIDVLNGERTQKVIANFINEADVVRFISNSKNVTQAEKEGLLKELGLKENVVLTSRFEIEFFKGLEIVLTQMGIDLELQKRVLNYKLDGYLPQYNLVIEYDEEQHKHQQKKDKQREKEIKKVLNCEFVRLDYKDNDFINIGKVMKSLKLVK